MRLVSFPTFSIVVSVLALCSTLPFVHSIPLLGGRFETTTDVQSLLNLGLDAADMREATDLATKSSIYTEVRIGHPSGAGATDIDMHRANALGHLPHFLFAFPFCNFS